MKIYNKHQTEPECCNTSYELGRKLIIDIEDSVGDWEFTKEMTTFFLQKIIPYIQDGEDYDNDDEFMNYMNSYMKDLRKIAKKATQRSKKDQEDFLKSDLYKIMKERGEIDEYKIKS